MKHLKKFNESDAYFNRQKSETEITNRHKVMREWLKAHPFDGVTEIVFHPSTTTKSLDIYFGSESYISITSGVSKDYDSDIHRKTSTGVRISKYINWRMRGSDRDIVVDNKDKFLTWCDKLLIHCEMNRDVLIELEETIDSNKRLF